MMDGTASPTTVRADISVNPDSDPFTGAGSINLDASGSIGEGLEYFWTIAANDQSFYTIADDDAISTTLSLADPTPAQYVMITLTVTDVNGTMDSDSETFLHVPSSGSTMTDLGFLVTSTTNLQVGDEVSVRAIGHDGTETYYPSPPLVVDGSNNGAWNWPVALRQAIGSAAPIEVGVLNAGTGQVRQLLL